MRLRSISLCLALLAATGACTSAETKAANAAALAEVAFNQGRIPVARVYIQQALAQRDDVSDYWILLARINLGSGNASGAFDAYENALTLDRGNVEALSSLCQLAIGGNVAPRAEKYADQLAVLDPNSTLPATVRAAAALARNDKAGADRFLAQVLGPHPDDLGALMVKSRRLAADEKYAEAAAVIETTFSAPGNPTPRLMELVRLYGKAGDRAGYQRSIARLARANPDDPRRQLDYAELLYDGGERDEAYAVTRAILTASQQDVAVAAAVLDLWLQQGPAAMPAASITTDAAELGVEARAAYAQYASEMGHPEVALAILGADGDAGPPDQANADALAAAAYARALQGQRGAALATLNAILSTDPSQTRALLARGRIGGNAADAVADLRKVVSEDPENVTARLALADTLLKRRDDLLARSVLREGLDLGDGDPRLAERLARLLTTAGRRAEATAVLTDYARANPMSRRAAALAARGA